MKKLKIFKAFTLVELIIVITILAILSTIAFVSFQSYTSSARDSNRQVTLKEISKSLDINKVVTGTYPVPESIYATGNIIGTNLFQVGVIGDNISRLLKINKTPLDPISNTNYLYGLSLDNKYYQIAGTAENLSAGIISQTYAESNEKLKAVVEGNYKGLLYFSTGSKNYIANFPSIIFSRSGTYTGTGNYYIVNGKTNIPYSLKGNTFDNPKDENALLTELYNSGVTLTGVVFDYTKEDFTKLSLIPDELGKLGIDAKEVIGQIAYGNTYSSSVAWFLNKIDYPCSSDPTSESAFNFSTGTNTIDYYDSSIGGPDVIIPCYIGLDKVLNIGTNAFSMQLSSVYIPNGIKTIGDNSFGNANLNSLNIPNSVISIGSRSFQSSGLKSLILPNSVKNIGESAFLQNSSLVTVNMSPDYIGTGAFLQSGINNLSLGNNLISIGEIAFLGNKLSSLTIPNSVISIGKNAFYWNLITTLDLGNNVNSIGNYAFNKNKLTKITIPPSLTNLGLSPFSGNGLSQDSNYITDWTSGSGGTWNLSGTTWVKQ